MIAATPQRLRRAFHSGAALPGLYSGPFYSARSVRKAMGPLESPKSENPLRKQRGLQQGGDEMNERELPEGVL